MTKAGEMTERARGQLYGFHRPPGTVALELDRSRTSNAGPDHLVGGGGHLYGAEKKEARHLDGHPDHTYRPDRSCRYRPPADAD